MRTAMVGRFEGELDIRRVRLPERPWWRSWIPRRRRYLVLSTLTWYGPDGLVVTITPGFVTDFASIPFFLYFLIGPMYGWFSDYDRSAVLHDLLYRMGAAMAEPVSRARADRAFLHALCCDEVLWLTRHAMWAAVRLFGWTAYRRSGSSPAAL